MTKQKSWLMAGAFVALVWSPTALAAPRNVVLMIGDDHGMQAGCYGDTVIRTPAMDRLARQGTRFANAFAAVASCSPSRSVILTGQFTHTNGQYGLAHDVHNFHSFDRVRSLPNLLAKAGYRTGIVGKHHVLPMAAYAFAETLPCPGGAKNVAAMAESARAFMAGPADRPFFLLVGFTDPHRAQKGFANDADYRGVSRIRYRPQDIRVPSWLPDNDEVRADLADYYESVSRLDQGIGMVLDAVDATGHAGDTLILYVSDNGPPFPGAKTTLYEPGIHLPLLLSSPGEGRRGVVSRAMVSFVDVAPTVLEWAGVRPPDDIAGRSLLPILGEENPPGRDVVYGSHTFHEVTMYYPMRMIRTRDHKYILNLAHPLEFPFASDLWNSPTWQGVLRRGDANYGRRTVAALRHRPREELYDLCADPDETRNVADDPAYAKVLEELRRQLRDWQEKTRDPWTIKYRHE